MYVLKERQVLGMVFLLGMQVLACSGRPPKPCTDGGQPSREGTVPFRGIKRCLQVKDQTGNFVNDGKYREWYDNDDIALEGEYRLGKKTGRWVEYDHKRKIISDKWFLDGKEVPPP